MMDYEGNVLGMMAVEQEDGADKFSLRCPNGDMIEFDVDGLEVFVEKLRQYLRAMKQRASNPAIKEFARA